MTDYDAVKKPAHYANLLFGKEPYFTAQCLPWNLGNALKYVWRAGLKTKDPNQDLDKALQCIAMERERALYMQPEYYLPLPIWLMRAIAQTPAETTRLEIVIEICNLASRLRRCDYWRVEALFNGELNRLINKLRSELS